MGIFKSSKPPQPPIPNFALHLACPADKVYTPNDVVSGYISLIPAAPIQPHAIEVCFWGKSTVWIRTSHSNNSSAGSNSTNYHHFRDNVTLFNVTLNLFQKVQLLQPGQQYTFPFEIRIPQGTGANRTNCYKSDTDERFTIFPHDLPPSFLSASSEKYPDSPDHAKIEYGISTRLICPGVDISVRHGLEPIAGNAPILFAPLNPNPQIGRPLAVLRFPKEYTLSSSTLAGQDPSSIGFRQRIHDRFSSETPKLDFEAAVELPDVLTSGSEFQFRVSFAALRKSENVVQVPAILFKILKLDLLDFTFARAPRDWDASTMASGHHYKGDGNVENGAYSGQEETWFREKKTHLNTVPDAKVIMLEEVPSGEKKAMEQEQNCEFWFSARVPGFTPPSFKSFAVTRQYRLKIKVAIEIGGKKFELEAESYVRQLGSAP